MERNFEPKIGGCGITIVSALLLNWGRKSGFRGLGFIEPGFVLPDEPVFFPNKNVFFGFNVITHICKKKK